MIMKKHLYNAYDRNRNKLNKGDKVEVHQEEGISMAVVIEPYPDNPTVNEFGCWVDIAKDGELTEGMPSYLLEKKYQ